MTSIIQPWVSLSLPLLLKRIYDLQVSRLECVYLYSTAFAFNVSVKMRLLLLYSLSFFSSLEKWVSSWVFIWKLSRCSNLFTCYNVVWRVGWFGAGGWSGIYGHIWHTMVLVLQGKVWCLAQGWGNVLVLQNIHFQLLALRFIKKCFFLGWPKEFYVQWWSGKILPQKPTRCYNHDYCWRSVPD